MLDRPLVALTLAFAGGIALASLTLTLAWGCLLLFLLLSCLYATTHRSFWGGGALLMAFLLLGAARYMTVSLVPANDIRLLAPTSLQLTGVVESDVRIVAAKGRSHQEVASFTLAAQSVTEETSVNTLRSLPVAGNLAVRVPLRNPSTDSETSVSFLEAERSAPHYGDLLTIQGDLTRPEGPRNPGGFDERASLERQGVFSVLAARRPNDWHRDSTSYEQPWIQLSFAARQGVLRHLHRALPPLEASVLSGILLGEKADLPPAVREDFGRTGTAHLLATAGLHVGLVAALGLYVLRCLRISRRPALFCTLFALALFAVMAGGRPSVVRAVLMADICLLGILLEREPDLPNALALSALVLFVWNPRNLFDPGFQLSFATMVTLLLLLPLAEKPLRPLRERDIYLPLGKRWGRKALLLCADCLFLAVAAQMGSAPLVAYYFNEVAGSAFLVNALAVPLLAPMLGLGFSAAVLAACWPPAAIPFDLALRGLLTLLLALIRGSASLPFASFTLASPSPLLIVAYYALLWGGIWYLRTRTRHGYATVV